MNNEKNKLVNFPDVNSRRNNRQYYDDVEDDLDENFENEEEYVEENPFAEDFDEGFEEDEQVSNENKKSKKSKQKKSDVEEKKQKKKPPKKTENVKKVVSAQAKVTKKVVKTILSFFSKHPYVLVVLFILLIMALFAIYLLLLDGDKGGSSDLSSTLSHGITSSQCNYGTKGINDETVVELINCEATKDNYTVLKTIPLEKYIAGVAIAEMGENYVDEAMKAQLVAVRSYTLTRNIPEYSAGYDSSKNVIRMRACENDQVYWDYTQDIYRSADAVRSGVSKYSPEYTPSEGETPWKKALTSEQINKYEALVSTVMGEFLVDSNDNVIATGYTNVETEKFVELANANAGTENGKYTAILLNVYGSSKVNEAVCTVAYSGASGEFTTWKQKATYGAPWANVKIGYDAENNKNITINDVGCLIVSIAMQITNSGIPTGEIVDFNPGTFAEALKANGNISASGALNSWDIKKIIPGFEYVGTKYFSYDADNFQSDKLKNYQTIKSYADQGYYIVIEVRKHDGGQHWVALDVANSTNANWQDIYIWDPATNYTSIGAYSKYRVNRIAYYKVERGENT